MTQTHHVRTFQRVGEDLFRMGLNNSHSGNMSLRLEGKILITRSGSQLGRLGWNDVVETALHFPDAASAFASTELPAHRAIYAGTAHRAILHCHAPHATTVAWQRSTIVPEDAEGKHYFDEIPVIEVANPIGTEELGDALVPILRKRPAAIVRSHGVFVAASDLDRCLQLTSCLESICRLLFLRQCFDGGEENSSLATEMTANCRIP